MIVALSVRATDSTSGIASLITYLYWHFVTSEFPHVAIVPSASLKLIYCPSTISLACVMHSIIPYAFILTDLHNYSEFDYPYTKLSINVLKPTPYTFAVIIEPPGEPELTEKETNLASNLSSSSNIFEPRAIPTSKYNFMFFKSRSATSET